MSAGSAAGLLAAVLTGRKRRRIIAAFKSGGALSRERSMTIDQLGIDSGWLLHMLLLRGVVVEAEPGRYHLDELRRRMTRELAR